MLFALLQKSVDSVARDVYFYQGTGGNIDCRKVSPCSTRASVIREATKEPYE